MNVKAELIEVGVNWKNGCTRLVLELDRAVRPADAEKHQGKSLRLRLCEWRDKRSLDANAYYWVLLTKLASALEYSLPAMHNMMLRRFGVPDIYDGKMAYVVLPEGEETEKKVMESETYHLKPTSEVKAGKDNKVYRTFILMRGSSTYDSKEFSTLLNGLIEACKDVGIDVATPLEIERMMDLYEEHRSGR